MRSRRKRTKRTVRASIWGEVGGRRAITSRGADVLEQIAVHGSLREAARVLGMAYRSAWEIVRVMNQSWPKPLVKISTGGLHGGGMRLTKMGEHVLRIYRDLQAQVDHLIETVGRQALADIGRVRR